MPAAAVEKDLQRLSGIEGVAGSGCGHRSRGWRRSEVGPLPDVLGCEDVKCHLARAVIRGRHIAVADAVSADSIEVELTSFQPGAQAHN